MKISLFILILFLFVSCNEEGIKEIDINDSKRENSIRAFKINISKPEKYSLKIVNNYHKNVSFRFVLNGNRIYSTIDDIVKDIKKMPDEYPDEPIYRKVWRYTFDNSEHKPPLSERFYYHIPQLFFNSIGFGYCDDRANVNYFLWKRLGYESRIWWLGGHVVSELKIDGKWEMYDSDLKVYYLNIDNSVASVKDIMNNPDLVTVPINPIIDTNNIKTNAYSLNCRSIYSEPPENYFTQPKLEKINFESEIYLATDSYVLFPVKKLVSIKTETRNSKGKKHEHNSFSILSYIIKNRDRGVLPYPFLIFSIEGDGSISFNRKEFTNIDDNLNRILQQWNAFYYPVFYDSKDSISVNFLLNKNRFSLKHTNTLLLKGEDIDSLSIELSINN